MYKPCRLAPPLLGRVMVPLWCCSQCSGFSRGLTVTTFRARVSPACRISCTTRSCDARTTFSPLIYKDWFGSTLIYITVHMNCVSSICFRHWNFNSISIQYCSGLRHVTSYKVIIKVDCQVLIIYQIFGQFITSWQVNVSNRKGGRGVVGCKFGAVNTCCKCNIVNKKKNQIH